MTETTGSRQPDGKTLREIAEEIGVDKTTVFRFVKSAGIAAMQRPATLQRNAAQRFDATAETAIKQHFAQTLQRSATLRNVATATPCNADAIPCNDAAQYLATLERALEDARDDHRGELDRIRADHAAALDAIEQKHSAELDDLRQQLEQLRRVCDRLRQERDDGRQDCEQLRDDLRQAAAERDALRILLEKAETTAEQLRRDVTEERQRCGELSNQLAQLAADAHRLTDQAQRLQLAAMQPPAMIGDGSTAAQQRPSLWARLFKRKGGRET